MRARVWGAIAAAALVGPSPVSAQFHLEDSLRGGTSGNPIGGGFSSEGWTVTGQNDRIWWALPRLTSGSIEFTLTNATLANLVAADGEIFAMYEAGHDIEEPIPYSPELRNNHYKAFIRVYGTDEVGRAGSMKLIWIMCPSGAPGYSTDGALCGCESFLEEPFDDPGPWDGSPQRIRLEWGGGVSRLLRNGAEVVRVDWGDSGIEFGPHELHFMLGNPRNGAVGDGASMPIGAIFSDVVVDGAEGPVATCGGSGDPDAGVPPAPDAGVDYCDRPERLHAVAIEPPAGRGDAQVFRATYKHCDGWDAFRVVQLTVGDAVDALAQVPVAYEDGRFHLGEDSCASGEARTLANAYGALDCARSGVSMAVDDLVVDWALSFEPDTFPGTHGLWMDGKGPASTTPEPRIGWTRMGDYTVERASSSVDAGARDAGGRLDGGGRHPGVSSGCGCRASSAPSSIAPLALALALLAARRRRRA